MIRTRSQRRAAGAKHNPRFHGFAGACLKLIAIALGAGVLLIGVLRWLPAPTTSFMLQRQFTSFLGERPCERIEHHWVDWEQISPNLAIAVVAAEDQRFPDHYGFDFHSIGDAMEARLAGGRMRGASTISQQVAKNLFLWPGTSWVRKGIEAYLTVLIEMLWPKPRILETYLNIAQFGDCTFGVEAASRRFFGKSAAALTRSEAALLAAVLPNPQRYRAERPSGYVRKRSAWILRQIGQLGGARYVQDMERAKR